jgi:hypothetical protein
MMSLLLKHNKFRENYLKLNQITFNNSSKYCRVFFRAIIFSFLSSQFVLIAIAFLARVFRLLSVALALGQ